MDIDHEGRAGEVPTEFGVSTLVQIVPPDFVTYVQNGAFCGLQRMPKSISVGAVTPLGELTMLPRPSCRLWRGHPSPFPTSLGTDPPSALAMRPPEFQPDLCLCTLINLC